MFTDLKGRIEGVATKDRYGLARSFPALRDIRDDMENALQFQLLTNNMSVPYYWRVMNESHIDKYSKTLEHLETRSRAHQQDEITNSLIRLITSCEDSIGNKSFFCTAFRIFHDTKVRKLSSKINN